VDEDAADNPRVLDRGHYPHPLPAPRTRQDIQIERPPQQVRAPLIP